MLRSGSLPDVHAGAPSAAGCPCRPFQLPCLPARRILYVRNLPFNISPEEVRRRAPQGCRACGPRRRRRRCCAHRRSSPPPAPPQLYSLFGKYGAVRQIRVGNSKETRGTAYVVYEDIYDAKTAVDHLSGFNVQVGAGVLGAGCCGAGAACHMFWALHETGVCGAGFCSLASAGKRTARCSSAGAAPPLALHPPLLTYPTPHPHRTATSSSCTTTPLGTSRS